MTEADLLRNIIDVASILGWESAHFRPALTSRGWRTPVQGSMGKGFPDLVLVHPRQRRMILAELKSDTGKLSPDQQRVMEDVLDPLRWGDGPVSKDGHHTILELWIWRPKDWNEIVAVLRG